MHGYSKISKIHSSRSKSIDFSDLIIPPQPQKTNENISPNHVLHETQEFKQSDNNNLESKNSNNGSSRAPDIYETTLGSSHFSSEYEDNDQKNINSLKLSRNFSVSSTTGSQRFMRLDRQSSSKKAIMQSAMKRAFSVSRSSSVSEKYTRMHNNDDYSSPLNEVLEGNNHLDNNGEIMQSSRSMKKEKTSGGKRIMKACKRLFGR